MKLSRTPRLLAAAIVLIAAAAALSACSSSGEGTPTVKAVSGTARIIDKSGHSEKITRSRAVGSTNTVSAGGRGSIVQLSWPDGSYLRLSGNSRFLVGGNGVAGTVKTGTVWARAGKDASSGFVLGTGSGRITASRSTLFVVNCNSSCQVSDLKGTVSSGRTSLKALTTAALASGLSKPAPLRWDAVFADAFAKTNGALDQKAGFGKPAELYADASPANASLTGTFAGTRTLTQANCTGLAINCVDVVVGNVAQRTYTFAIDCSAGIPCVGQVVTDIHYTDGKPDGHPRVPLSSDGTTYSWSDSIPGTYCKTGKYSDVVSWTIHPVAASMVNGQFLATKLSGAADTSSAIIQKSGNSTCDSTFGLINDKGTLDVSRQ
jgi:hypothetical protein